MRLLHWHDIQRYRTCPARFRHNEAGLAGSHARVNAKMLYGALWHALFVAHHAAEPAAAAFERSAADLAPESRTLALELWPEVEADFEWYLEHQARTLRITEVVWIERPGATLLLPIHGDLAICGTPDLVGYVEADWGGGLVVLDHKTFGVLSETEAGPRYEAEPRPMTLNGYFHARQFSFYVGVWNRLHPDQPIETAVLNLVPQRVTHVLAFLQSRKGKPKLPEVRREIIPYDPTYCERLVREAVHTAEEIDRKLKMEETLTPPEREALWPQHDHACFHFNEVCPYLELCEAGDSLRGTIEASYREPA